MLKKIIGTAGARLICSLLGFLVLIISTNKIGADGVGTIYGQIILGITIILMISNFVGGGALVYLVPRHDVFKIFILSYFWAIIAALIGTFTLLSLNLIPKEYTIHLLILSLLQSFSAINYNILLGKEKIKNYNIINIVQSSMMFLCFLYLIFINKQVEVISFVYALYFGFSIAFILSFSNVISFIKISNLDGVFKVLKEQLRLGVYVQSANIIQLFNYRLSYYFIEYFLCRPVGNNFALGIYSTSNQLSEGTWLISKSVAMIQYSKISNTKAKDYAKKLSLSFLKFSFVITVILFGIVLLMPESVFVFVFGDEFLNIKPILYSLSIGIVSVAITMMFSHYFSGIGKPYINTIGSAIGFVFTLVLGLILIPRFGLIGAGITASVSYFVSAVYAFIVFMKFTNTGLREFLITKNDYYFIIKEIKQLIRKN